MPVPVPRGHRYRCRALQGLTHLGLAPRQLGSLLGHAANMAALQSLFVGQLPPATAAQAGGWLAQVNFTISPCWSPNDMHSGEVQPEC